MTRPLPRPDPATTNHNPGDYAGDYQCGGVLPDECPVKVEHQDVFSTDKPLTNPKPECAEFGLLPSGTTG